MRCHRRTRPRKAKKRDGWPKLFEPGVSILPNDGDTATGATANRQSKPEKTWANQPDFSQRKQEDEFEKAFADLMRDLKAKAGQETG